MKNVLLIASEAVPFIKSGGLADVAGSLPKYFDKTKFDVRVMIPKYTCIPWEYREKMVYKTHFYIDLAWRTQYVGVFELEWNGVTFYFIDNEFFFGAPPPYTRFFLFFEFFLARLHFQLFLCLASDQT